MVLLYNKKKNKNEDVAIDTVMEKIYFLDYELPKNKSDEIKKEISQVSNKFPLYDIYTENIYLFDVSDIYDKVIREFYRFPDDNILEELINKKKSFKPIDDLEKRKLKKINYMIDFLNSFDLKLLQKTFEKAFSKQAGEKEILITSCKKLSFLPQFTHIQPYYTKDEIINQGLNYGIIDKNNKIDDEKIIKICNKMKEFEIDYNTLLEHLYYMQKNNIIGLIQYYTLQGSNFMNRYLRNQTMYTSKNIFLEKLINKMWNIVVNSPAFSKNIIVYRFIKDDNYLSNLEIGDIFMDEGFTSTTRDPFYNDKHTDFGNILIKINIPPNKKGIGLCLETVSHFPNEQEIIFPPFTKLKLIGRDKDCKYYSKNKSHIHKKYEFEWVDNSKPKDIRKTDSCIVNTIDFLNIRNQVVHLNSVEQKINYLKNNHINEQGQFFVMIGNKKIIVICEIYDSSDTYKKFYSIKTKEGFGLYVIYNDFLLFYIEISDKIEINYYVKYSEIDISDKHFTDDELNILFSSIAHYFNIEEFNIYAKYATCVKDQFNSNYCLDIYNYIHSKNKRCPQYYNPNFSYYDLDLLHTLSLEKVLKKTDRDEIYQLWKKVYTDENFCAPFYIWLKNNKCYLIDKFVSKLDNFYGKNNPFYKSFYTMNAKNFLYDKKLINDYNDKDFYI